MTAGVPEQPTDNTADIHEDVSEGATMCTSDAAATHCAPYIDPTRFEVSMLPIGHEFRQNFTMVIEWRGIDKWAVLDRMGRCAGRRTGQRAWESSPSSRTDRFRNAYRFDLDTAIFIARREAPRMTCNGWTVERALSGEFS